MSTNTVKEQPPELKAEVQHQVPEVFELGSAGDVIFGSNACKGEAEGACGKCY